jgi:hypothetical protein
MDKRGNIWLADQTVETAVAGTIDLAGKRPVVHATTELIPSFISIPVEGAEGKTDVHMLPFGPEHEEWLIYANTPDGTAVTVANAYTSMRNDQGHQDLTGQWSISGDHVAEGTEYASVRVKIRNFDLWRRPVIQLNPDTRVPVVTLPENESPSVAALAPRAQLALEAAEEGRRQDAETYWIVATHLLRLRLDQVLASFARPIRDLVTIATNSRSAITELQLMRHAAGGSDRTATEDAEWVRLMHHSLLEPTAPAGRPEDRIVPYRDVGQVGYATWLSKSTVLDVIPTLVANQVALSATSLETSSSSSQVPPRDSTAKST